MARADSLPAGSQPGLGSTHIGLKNHLAFVMLSMLALMAMYSILRLALLVYNHEQIGTTPASMLAEAFVNGLRFDLRLAVFACAPLLLALLSKRAMHARGPQRIWLTLFASLTLFLGLVELDFYR
jgi:phosphoglycerol transferase MdoB-like AlkP superfamily enzyme